MIELPKQLDVTRSELVAAARSPEGAGFGGSSNAPARWDILIRIDRYGHVRARLSIAGAPAVNLDYHMFDSDDGAGCMIPPGYHWDIWPPLADRVHKVYVDPQPADPSAALDLLVARWYLQLNPDANRPLRWPR